MHFFRNTVKSEVKNTKSIRPKSFPSYSSYERKKSSQEIEGEVLYKHAHLWFPRPSFKTSVISLFSPVGLLQFSSCHSSENHNTKLTFIEGGQGPVNSTVALQVNLNIIFTHKFPFSSVKAELPLRCGNNKEKILLSLAPKNRLAEALVGSLLETKGPCGSQGKQNMLSTT